MMWETSCRKNRRSFGATAVAFWESIPYLRLDPMCHRLYHLLSLTNGEDYGWGRRQGCSLELRLPPADADIPTNKPVFKRELHQLI
jgi:hypothetical protein